MCYANIVQADYFHKSAGARCITAENPIHMGLMQFTLAYAGEVNNKEGESVATAAASGSPHK